MDLFVLTSVAGIDTWIIWLLLTVFLIIIELVSHMLLTIWFVLGGVAAMIAALLGASTAVQILVFIFVSAVTVAIGWRNRDKLNIGTFHRTATNADRLIGRTGIVSIPIDILQGQGQVKVGGMVWSAVTHDEKVIPVGSRVRVLAIQGVKLIVEIDGAARSEEA